MHHSHDEFGRLIPRVGDSMVTNLRRPIFTMLEDTGPGVHDTTVSACDQYLYQQQIGVVSCPRLLWCVVCVLLVKHVVAVLQWHQPDGSGELSKIALMCCVCPACQA